MNVVICMKDHNAEITVTSFRDHNLRYVMSSFITAEVAKWILSSVLKIKTQKSQSSFRGHNIRYVMLSFQTGVCCGCVTPENFEHIEAKWCSLLHSRGKESTQSIMINHKFMWPKFEKKNLSIFHYNFWTVFVGKFLRFWTIFIAKW